MMNFINPMRVLQLHKNIIIPIQYALQVNNYAVGMLTKGTKKAKKGQVVEKLKLPVETDVKKLLTYCCGTNYFIEGEDVKLKPDSEYPDWLWTLHTGPPKPVEELDPNTKDYWRRMRKIGKSRNLKLKKHIKKF